MIKRLISFAALLLLLVGGIVLWRQAARRPAHEMRAMMVYAERAKALLLDNVGPHLKGDDFTNAKMRGATLQEPRNAFQGADFSSAELDQATLTAGHASFQFACFDDSSLTNARLSGGASSFQVTTFENADLTGASLKGSFQVASFRNAVLHRTKLVGSFQSCDLSGAAFSGADLTGVNQGSLESCYFTTPPEYSSSTRFPKGFDPGYEGWQEVAP